MESPSDPYALPMSAFLTFRFGLFSGMLLLMALSLPSIATAQAPCVQALSEAESRYRRGRFEAAARLAKRCLETEGLPEARAIQAYRLLGLIYLRQDSLEAAKRAVTNLLTMAPDYAPDPVVDPPIYVSLVAIVRQERGPFRQEAPPPAAPEPSWFRQNWGWLAAGGGLVVTSLVTLLLGGGSGGGGGTGTEPLPPPPPPPQ